MSSYTYMVFVQNGWYAIPNFCGLEEALRGNEEKRSEADKKIKEIISSSCPYSDINWDKIVSLESFCKGLRETKIVEQYEKMNLRELKFSIHVWYSGKYGWGHEYRVAHGVSLKHIVGFMAHREMSSAKKILRACGMRFPHHVDINTVRVSFVATLDWDMLFKTAKRLDEEKNRRFNSRLLPVEQISLFDPYSSIMP